MIVKQTIFIMIKMYVCNACTMYVLCSKQMVCNAYTIFDCGSNTCVKSNFESRMMLLKQSRTLSGSEHIYCLCFDIRTNACALPNCMNDM